MTSVRPGEKLLLISPAFHGYHDSIASGFQQLGYDLQVYCYDSFSTPGMKLRNKALLELPAQLGFSRKQARTEWDTQRAIQALRAARPQRVLLIKADTLGADFWTELRAMKVPVMLWLYDDLARHDHTMEFLREIGPVISYARQEAQLLADHGVDAHYLPNGYDPALVAPVNSVREEVVFVGSRYPNRVELMEYLHAQGVPVRTYGRQWSRHPADRLRTWEWARPQIPSHRDISLRQAYAVQAQAAAAINIHGLQAGLAMRTFEVPGNGGLQLVDRQDVAEFYEPGTEVLTFSSKEELAELCQRLITKPQWGAQIRAAGQRRSLAEHTFAHRARTAQEWWS